MSELLAIGVSHKTAPVEVRERLALPEPRAAEFMRDLRGAADVHEAVAISTCNRTELYLVVGDPVEAESTVLAMLARQAGIRPTGLAGGDLLAPQLRRRPAPVPGRRRAGVDDRRRGRDPGPGQARLRGGAGQGDRRPADQPPVQGGAGDGKRVRTETAIGERQLSLPRCAVALAREQLGELTGREVVIIGTGETSELTARALADSGVRDRVRGQSPA